MYIKLFESFKSQKDLEKLTDIILETYSDEIINDIEHKFFKMTYDNIPILSLSIFNSDIFSEIKKFIDNNSDLQIIITNKKNFYDYKGGENAQYITDSKGNQLIQILGDSKFSNGKSIIDKINSFIDNWDGNWDEKEYDYTDDKYSSSFSKMKKDIKKAVSVYASTLLHELQHAYDNWRSKGKYIEEIKKMEIKLKEGFYEKYLNLKHEIDARFTQTISDINFKDVDWDLSSEFSNTDFLYTILPFKEILKDFKRLFKGYDILNRKDKVRVDKKLAQFYQFEKGLINKHNLSIVAKDNNISERKAKTLLKI